MYMVFGELVGDAVSTGEKEKKWIGCLLSTSELSGPGPTSG